MRDSPSPLRAVWTWPLPLAAVWLVVPVAGLLLRIALEPVAPHDYWWHLAMGRMFDATGRIPDSNLFLYTLPVDRPFFDQPWLAQWALYRIVEAWGHAGAIVVRNVVVALTWTILLAASLRRCCDPRFTGGWLLVVAAITGPIFAVRTQMFALVPYVLLTTGLLAVADGTRSRHVLWGLVPLTAVWANLHGTFVLAPVLVGLTGGALLVEAWLEGDGLEGSTMAFWSSLTVAVAASACLTPFGPGVYGYVVDLTFSSNLSATVSEWRPPDVTQPFGMLAVASILGSTCILALRRRSVRLYEAVLFGATAYLGLDAIRSLFWWGAIAALVVPRHLHEWFEPSSWEDAETSRVLGLGHALVVGGLVAAAILAQPGWPVFRAASASLEGYARRSGEGAGLLNYQNATELVEHAANRNGSQRIFHAQAIGGLIGYEIGAARPQHPRAAAFLDQRMALIPTRIWDSYFAISRASEGWQRRLRAHEIDTLILTPEEQWLLIQEVQASPDWRLEAVGEAHLLFVRASDAPSPPNENGTRE